MQLPQITETQQPEQLGDSLESSTCDNVTKITVCNDQSMNTGRALEEAFSGLWGETQLLHNYCEITMSATDHISGPNGCNCANNYISHGESSSYRLESGVGTILISWS